MPPEPIPHPSASAPRKVPELLHIRAFWASLSIISMWIVVLFVGIFGDDLVVNNTNGFTQIPVVVFLLPFVLPGTIAIARRGFTSAAADLKLSRDQGTQTPHVESAKSRDSDARAA